MIKVYGTSKLRYTDDDIINAIDDIRSHGCIRAAGLKYGIPFTTLRNKFNGERPLFSRRGGRTLLTSAEEERLVKYIKEATVPVTRENVQEVIKKFYEDEVSHGYCKRVPWNVNGKPGRTWWRLFQKRHPEITSLTEPLQSSVRREKNLIKNMDTFEYEDQNIFPNEDKSEISKPSKPSSSSYTKLNLMKNIDEIEDEDLNEFLIEDNLDILKDSSRNFNMGELVFALNPEAGSVANMKQRNETEIDYSLSITILATVCANGESLPPCMIYPRRRIDADLEERFPSSQEFPYIIRRSKSGFTTSDNLHEYFVHSFNMWLITRRVKKPVIMWTDCHGTQNNQKLAKTLRNFDIILYDLPSNGAHFMEPVDVSVFGPVKSIWAQAVHKWEEKTKNVVLYQKDFAMEVLPFYYEFYTPLNIKNEFHKCELFVYETDVSESSKLKSLKQHEELQLEETNLRLKAQVYGDSTMDIKVEIKAEPLELETHFENEFIDIMVDDIKLEENGFSEDNDNPFLDDDEGMQRQNKMLDSFLESDSSNILRPRSEDETRSEESDNEILFQTLQESPYPMVLIEKLSIEKEKAAWASLSQSGNNYDQSTTLRYDDSFTVKNYDEVFTCSICGFVTGERKSFGAHLLEHSKWMKCPECDYRTIEKGNLEKHALTHTESQLLKCSICGYGATDEGQLKRHEVNHLKTKMVKCGRCSFSTVFKEELQIHTQSHADKTLLMCFQCNFKTKDKKKLQTHLSKHSELLSCPHCKYRTDAPSRLKTHSVVHSKAKLYRCSECSFETNHKVSLKTHKLTHLVSRMYKCSKCSYQTNYKGNYQKHLKNPHTVLYNIRWKDNQQLNQ